MTEDAVAVEAAAATVVAATKAVAAAVSYTALLIQSFLWPLFMSSSVHPPKGFGVDGEKEVKEKEKTEAKSKKKNKNKNLKTGKEAE